MDMLTIGNILTNGLALATTVKPAYEIFKDVLDVRNAYVEKQTKTFVEDVYNKAKDIKIQDIHKNDILHNFWLTFDYVTKVRKQEHIKYFIELYYTYLQDEALQTAAHNVIIHDKYELAVNLLANLTAIEFELLVLLNKYEKPHRISNPDKPLQRIDNSDYWDEFIIKSQNKFGLEKTAIVSLFQKLHANGMFIRSESVGFYHNDNNFGILSDLFIQILDYLPSITNHGF